MTSTKILWSLLVIAAIMLSAGLMWQNYGGSYDHDTDLTYEYIRAKGGDIHEHIKPLRGTSNCEETAKGERAAPPC